MSYLKKFQYVNVLLALTAGSTSAAVAGSWDQLQPGAPNFGLGSAPTVVAGDSLYGAMPWPSARVSIVRWRLCDGWREVSTFYAPDNNYPFITDIKVSGGSLYVAGYFSTDTPEGAAVNIASYDLHCETWHKVGDGSISNVIEALTVDASGQVYIGLIGNSDHGVSVAPMLKKWNGSTWVTLGQGMYGCSTDRYGLGLVTTLDTDGTHVFAAGLFDAGVNTDGTRINSRSIIEWDGSQWLPMGPSGSGIQFAVNSEPTFQRLLVSGTNIFVTGNFRGGDSEIALPVGLDQFSTSRAHVQEYGLQVNNDPNLYPGWTESGGSDLYAANGLVYIAGDFDTIVNQAGNDGGGPGFAQWSGTSWTAVGDGNLTTDSGSHVMGTSVAADSHAVYVHGDFDSADGIRAINGSPIRWVLTADPPCIPCEGMVASWPLDGNALDVVRGQPDSLVGSFSWTPGEVGLAINLSAKPAGVSAADRPVLDFGAGVDFTIEGWVLPQYADTSYGVMDIIDKRVTPSDYSALGYELCLSSGQLAFQMSDNVNTSPLGVSGGSDLRQDGAWHHVAVTVLRSCTNGGKLYVDGIQVATFDPTPRPGGLATTQPLLIGMHPSSWLDCNFRGALDEISLYNRALEPHEIADIAADGPAGKPCRVCVAPPSNIIAWWPLEYDGTDIIGGNNGSVSGNYSFVPAVVGNGINMTANPAGVSVPDNTLLDFGAGTSFSVECWVQPLVATTSYGVMDIVDKRETPSDYNAQGYELCLVNGQLALQMSDNLVNSPLGVGGAGPDMRDGAWHHVAVTVQRGSSAAGVLYVDGQAVTSFDPSSEPGSLGTSQPLLIGMHPSPWLDCNFRGTIDEVSMYGRALTAAEIQAIYIAGSKGKCKP